MERVSDYARSVLSGRIVAGKLVRLAVERHLHDLQTGAARGLRFDNERARRAIDFFGLLRHTKGEWAGREFKLGGWQAFIVGSLFGWLREYGRCAQCDSWLAIDPGTHLIECGACFPGEEPQPPAEHGWLRRFRVAHIEISRKNGKSTLAAGVGLLLAFFDSEPGADVYAAATKRDQAKIVWSEAQRMVRRSALGAAGIKVLVANLHQESSSSKFEPLGSDEDSTDGLNPHGLIIDELHAHKTRGFRDVLITGMGSRRQPLEFDITTAGTDRDSICWEQRQLGSDVLSGTIDDDSFFAYIACIDDGDDWRDPKVWIKANPNLGVSVKPDYLLTQCKQAEQVPAKQNTYQRMHCGIWTQQTDRWIDLALWDANAGPLVNESDLAGRTCYGMLDLATVSDMTAWVMLFPREDDPETVDVLARFFCPRAKLNDTANRYRDQYQVWERQGWLTVTEGEATDYAFVKAQVLADAMRFRLVDMNVDRLFQAHQIASELAEEGLKVFGMGMGFTSMAAPMTELMRRLLAHKIRHGGNPVLRWMADNVSVKQDPAGNLKPDKSTSQGKIDGIIGVLGGLDRVMRHEDRRSVYEGRGMLSV